ncbi:MAG: GDP-mannose 4,6-dehydratase, partial [Syntrophales bacterium]|nr:GDP-mannose 4,6-dehydratase [Syntrophales bacterium]
AIWTIMTRGLRGETYNIGGAQEMENIAIVRMICDILDELLPTPDGQSRRRLITYVADRPGHDRRYAIDFGKLHAALKWSPRESFATGLRKTVAWYLDHPAWIDRIRSGEYQNWIFEQYGS